jgi:hypothetical protein
MVDIDLFLTALYVEVDDFLKTQSVDKNPGPDCKLTKSEAMTLLIFSQWRRFSSGSNRRFDTRFLSFRPERIAFCFPESTQPRTIEPTIPPSPF